MSGESNLMSFFGLGVKIESSRDVNSEVRGQIGPERNFGYNRVTLINTLPGKVVNPQSSKEILRARKVL